MTRTLRRSLYLVAITLGTASRVSAQQPAVPPAATQNPSPMVESSRAHERIAPRELAGTRRTFVGPLSKPVEVFVPAGVRHAKALHLVVLFHGDAFIPEYAVSQLGHDAIAAVVQLAPGAGVYDRTFSDPAAFDSLLGNVAHEASAALGTEARVARVTLVGFSAGHGAVRAILRDSAHFARVDAVLLLDGMHTSYVPEGMPVASGGTLDPHNLDAFVRFAQAALRGEKRFLVTHSEIFPGTFASTTETADYLLNALGLHRTPVLRWGPHGMQQTSEAKQRRFALLGFAGNSAPDHIDQFQSMPEMLRMLDKLR